MANRLVSDQSLVSVADAIREKTGSAELLAFPEGFTAAVAAISGTSVDPAFIDGSISSVTIPEGVTSIRASAFRACTAMTEVVIPNTVVTIGVQAFWDCFCLTKLILPPSVRELGTQVAAFSRIDTVDCWLTALSNSQTFWFCSSLTALILRSPDTVCTLSSTDSLALTPIESGNGWIYVPRALLDSYKAATNWSAFAAQFRAIEDYPDITGG